MFTEEPAAALRLIHGFQAEDWWASWNMHLNGTLFSVELANEVEFDGETVREMSIETLRAGVFADVASSPRMTCLSQAAIIRGGGWIGEGVAPYPTRRASVEESQRVLERADVELGLEEARRELAPAAPSRIACLFLAEASAAGRTMVSRLKGHDAFLMEVRIATCVRLARVDSRWLDSPSKEQHAGYWSGKARDGTPAWEYLLDGTIECVDGEELHRLREWAPQAGRRASGTQGPIGTPRAEPPNDAPGR